MPITISDIAQSFDIPKQHLMKVVNDLSRKGCPDTGRGAMAVSGYVDGPAISTALRYQCRPSGTQHRRAGCYRLSEQPRVLPDSACLGAARRVPRCDRRIPCGTGYIRSPI
ncbi:MAG: Rrf2 family transcriptional regulator [Bradyrhizobium sp.]|nr:Rrf2 family transcriptional regulator [Pseudomonadota bacterium]MDE2069474.1 Rrf2 family transcriptional regulator [Bradyrhizobium sp.]MDE2243800.1 Rrf2 family transcriptional regulator [Bradyrhizobium sp.]MDE2467269.1 Rrf2 family transcriptional regulator [Bradyrhizobium sp.]